MAELYAVNVPAISKHLKNIFEVEELEADTVISILETTAKDKKNYATQSQQTRDFFAEIQNKLHWAISGKTAAEIIYSEADAAKLYMGLKTWRSAPHGKILKSDVVVAKNYMSHCCFRLKIRFFEKAT